MGSFGLAWCCNCRATASPTGAVDNATRMSSESGSEEERFVRNLEQGGVVEALTDVLTLMYRQTDRPEDALEFIQKYFLQMFEWRCTQALKDNADQMTSLRDEIQEMRESMQTLGLESAAKPTSRATSPVASEKGASEESPKKAPAKKKPAKKKPAKQEPAKQEPASSESHETPAAEPAESEAPAEGSAAEEAEAEGSAAEEAEAEAAEAEGSAAEEEAAAAEEVEAEAAEAEGSAA